MYCRVAEVSSRATDSIDSVSWSSSVISLSVTIPTMGIISDYITTRSEAEQSVFQRIVDTVHSIVPEVEEVTSYGMPGYKYKGKYLLTFFAFKNHLSLFPGGLPSDLPEQIKPFATSKGTLQFTADRQIPDDTLAMIVQWCKDRVDQS